MRALIHRLIGKGYPVFNPLWKSYYPLHRSKPIHHPLADDAGEDVFGEIYRNNLWDCSESRSGVGSTMWQTAPIRRALPKIVARFGLRTMLDAPCGDFNWMRHVDLDADYIGGELVPDIVSDLQARYSGPRRRFMVLDITKGPLPDADLWMCRDVLFHLTNRDAMAVLRQFAQSDIRYFLSTTYPYLPANMDLERSGGFRTINLRKAPFCLPAPIATYDDFVAPYTPRVLGLWTRDQVREALSAGEANAQA